MTIPTFANVVVSDNGSADGSREFIAGRYGGRVQIVENGANLGFAAACNRAFAATSSEYVFLLNPDAELKDGALRAIVAFMDAHPRAAIAGSRIYNYDGTVQQSVGEFDTWAGAFLRSSAWGEWPVFRRYANGASLRDFTYDAPRRVDLAIGAALVIRRATIDAIGPFDERFFLYHEEVDYAKRAADAGWETWFVPASEAVHEGMGSARGPVQRREAQADVAPQVLDQASRARVVLRARRCTGGTVRALCGRRGRRRRSGTPPAALMAIAPDAVTTFDLAEGYRVVRSFGYAYGHGSRPRNVLKATFRSIGAFIGLAPVEYLTDAERARADSLDALLRKAESLGANGVIALQFQASEGPDGATRVLAFGEAVLLERLAPPANAT